MKPLLTMSWWVDLLVFRWWSEVKIIKIESIRLLNSRLRSQYPSYIARMLIKSHFEREKKKIFMAIFITAMNNLNIDTRIWSFTLALRSKIEGIRDHWSMFCSVSWVYCFRHLIREIGVYKHAFMGPVMTKLCYTPVFDIQNESRIYLFGIIKGINHTMPRKEIRCRKQLILSFCMKCSQKMDR